MPRKSIAHRIRRVFFWMHLAMGVSAGIIIMLMSVTGVMLGYERQMIAWIDGVPKAAEDCRVFHAGTRLENGQVVTNGGRVLCVTALGDSVRMARTRAYDVVERIRFDGMQYRKDIGHRALKRN